MRTENAAERETYWSSFYASSNNAHKLQPPSQFAAFVAQELPENCAIFDVGCGSGRDSLFFAALGFKVVALDKSENAIDIVRQAATNRNETNLECIVGDIAEPFFAEALGHLDARSVCVYARFFLHAITDIEQTQFFDALARTLRPGHLLAFEYRTLADEALQKHAPPHFRRYQRSDEVNNQLTKRKFEIVYTVEGQGFAKYREEDAIVARCLFRKL
jgi:SAM-dependent methyltransferase